MSCLLAPTWPHSHSDLVPRGSERLGNVWSKSRQTDLETERGWPALDLNGTKTSLAEQLLLRGVQLLCRRGAWGIAGSPSAPLRASLPITLPSFTVLGTRQCLWAHSLTHKAETIIRNILFLIAEGKHKIRFSQIYTKPEDIQVPLNANQMLKFALSYLIADG